MAGNMKPNYQKAKQAALDILKSQGLIEPPMNPAEIARNLGVNVFFVKFSDPEVAENVSGFYDAGEDAIYVNKDEAPKRQTFTIAHELGHRILHREWAESTEYKVLLRQDGNSVDPIEKEANAFAANLLVPRHILDKYYRYAGVEKLSELFAVSVPTIKNRLSFEYGI